VAGNEFRLLCSGDGCSMPQTLYQLYDDDPFLISFHKEWVISPDLSE
jgi:hypothetical protein